jgi:hypothetical protein
MRGRRVERRRVACAKGSGASGGIAQERLHVFAQQRRT